MSVTPCVVYSRGYTRDMNETMTTASTWTHPFEAAGLGKAPFRCVGRESFAAGGGAGPGVRVLGETSDGVRIETSPGTSCDYCGTYIINAFWILSSDARRFKVGCDCVAKTKDAALTKQVKRLVSEAAAAKRKARNAARRDARRNGPASAAQIAYAQELGATAEQVSGITLADCSALIDSLRRVS